MGHTQMIGVQSSQIYAIGYDEQEQMLSVRFKKFDGSPGSLYQYRNATKDLFDSFMAAESKGRFFGDNIKNAADKYPYTRVKESN